MISRIVKMTFDANKCEEFLEIFKQSKSLIRKMPGCVSLKLIRDIKHTNIFFTYSIWEAENDLENYRKSELFKGVWKSTKALFEAKAEAWSTEILYDL